MDSPRLSAAVRSLILDAEDLLYGLLRAGFAELPVTGAHALEVARLPDMHRDPFDRILLAQARWEGMSLGSVDAQLIGLPGVGPVCR